MRSNEYSSQVSPVTEIPHNNSTEHVEQAILTVFQALRKVTPSDIHGGVAALRKLGASRDFSDPALSRIADAVNRSAAGTSHAALLRHYQSLLSRADHSLFHWQEEGDADIVAGVGGLAYKAAQQVARIAEGLGLQIAWY